MNRHRYFASRSYTDPFCHGVFWSIDELWSLRELKGLIQLCSRVFFWKSFCRNPHSRWNFNGNSLLSWSLFCWHKSDSWLSGLIIYDRAGIFKGSCDQVLVWFLQSPFKGLSMHMHLFIVILHCFFNYWNHGHLDLLLSRQGGISFLVQITLYLSLRADYLLLFHSFSCPSGWNKLPESCWCSITLFHFHLRQPANCFCGCLSEGQL